MPPTAWRALRCRDGGRVDIREDANGRPHFIEVNPLAGLRPDYSDLCFIAGHKGLSYRDLIGVASFTDYFHFLVLGRMPDAKSRRVLDATLVAIAGFLLARRAYRGRELEADEGFGVRLVQPTGATVVATLGNFATKLLSGKPTGITRVHGQEQEVTLGGRCVLLYPIFHPAAALYTPRMLDVLKSDFARLPELMGREVAPPKPAFVAQAAAEPAVQLGLF